MTGLGIDAGGSSTRWLLLDESGTVIGQGKTEPITGHVFTPAGRRENLARLRGLLEAVLELARPDAVVGGVTGLHGDTEAAALFVEEVAAGLELPETHVHLDNDMGIAYASVFAPGEGILVYAGTGSVGYHLAADGQVVRAGGYGYLIDDAGAGYWLGHQGLKEVFRQFDERGRPSESCLAQAFYQDLGSDDWDDLVGTVYGGGRSRVAALAPVVAGAANQGDETAVAILETAGQELARLAEVLVKRVGLLPVAFAGGISQLSPLLTEAFRGALPAGVRLEVVRTEPVRAAARQALKLARQTES